MKQSHFQEEISIHHIPLDAWATIMIHVDPQNIVDTFEILFESNVFHVSEKHRLDVFWILVALARLELQKIDVPMNPYPDGREHLSSFVKLQAMGVSNEVAREVIEESEGNLFYAFELLGWV